MKKAEIKLIQEKIRMYQEYEREEKENALRTKDPEEKQYYLEQEKLNSCAANTLINLLQDLGISVEN